MRSRVSLKLQDLNTIPVNESTQKAITALVEMRLADDERVVAVLTEAAQPTSKDREHTIACVSWSTGGGRVQHDRSVQVPRAVKVHGNASWRTAAGVLLAAFGDPAAVTRRGALVAHVGTSGGA